MTPLQKYDSDVAKTLVALDDGQRAVLEVLESFFHGISDKQKGNTFIDVLAERLFGKKINSRPEIGGIYLWGGVGRGKTYLMDLFFECVPFDQKERTHFHRFMLSVHKKLRNLQGVKNPLNAVAKSIADRAKILFFDEFFVSDIGDAMLLAGLLEALFKRSVVLILTSNIYPDELYKNGLQRERFLPAINLIKANTLVVELKSGIDYRLQKLSESSIYHSPTDERANREILEKFNDLVPDQAEIKKHCMIQVYGRSIEVLHCSQNVAWFDFLALCDSPRSVFDYVEIARMFHTIIVSDIPQFSEKNEDKARRFVYLIDELYDRRVNLIVSAEVSIPSLYKGRKLNFEFKRTQSRLTEMQSIDYLCSAHLVT